MDAVLIAVEMVLNAPEKRRRMNTMSEDVWQIRWKRSGEIKTTPPTFIDGVRSNLAGCEYNIQQIIVNEIIMAVNAIKGELNDD